MSVESKIKFRAYAFIAAGFIVLAFIIGILYALWVALLAFLLWKAYKWMKILRFWKKEPLLTRKIIEYATGRLNEGRNSSNLWVQSLKEPELADFALNYHVELMARPTLIEKEYSDLIEGWTEWGGSRLEECVLSLPTEVLADNVGKQGNQIPMYGVMISKAALEIQIAEYALGLLNVQNPRETVSRRLLAKELEKRNSQDELLWAIKAETSTMAVRHLAKVLGEASIERN